MHVSLFVKNERLQQAHRKSEEAHLLLSGQVRQKNLGHYDGNIIHNVCLQETITQQ
jgi:hypothetical protein